MIELTEGALPVECELTTEQVAALVTARAVRVGPGPRAGLWKVRDNGYVGAAVIGGVEVRITPKTPVDRVFFLLGYARRPRGWRQEEVNAGEHAELLPALAHAYAMAADRALRQGVLQGYLEMEEALPVIRGRIREADQLRRRYGLPLPVEVRYDDYTVDIAENRLLLAASARLLRLPGLAVQTRKTLRHVIARLAGVTALVPGRPLPAWLSSRINTRYHTALGLAELVLRGASYELDDGTAVRVNGLLVEMWRVFEDFVTVALTEALRPHGGRSELQDKRHHLDHGQRVLLKPDLVRYVVDAGGKEIPAAVVDSKYKISAGPGGHGADLYQMLAYCTALGLERGHLVYAKGEAEPYRHVVRGAGIEIAQHAIDLTLQPADLLGAIERLAGSIIRSDGDRELESCRSW
ncbi:McrC family protein [Streptosporangium sp. 'caverna']|uniref:McrC family protein n=1 Tax=Streptosporangium sp. 'caverna' TaxID=2202249 RepID=UPI0013A6CAA8|nr:restriction endonuclease [Streptosporangium sp. 'caverna']